MALQINVPESYVPILRSICEQRLNALGNNLQQMQKEINELTDTMKSLDSVLPIPSEYYEDADEDKLPYNTEWTLTKKAKYFLEDIGKATVKELAEQIKKQEPDLEIELRELVTKLSASLAVNIKTNRPLFKRIKNKDNEYEYELKK